MYQITMPATPGATPVTVATASTLRQARREGRRLSRDRRDLTWQDVRVERLDGRLVEYSGPSR